MLTPYPPIYVPHGATKPACCPHPAPQALLPGVGPDVVLDERQRLISGGGGTVWGAAYDASLPWKRTRAGWWVVIDGFLPQHLLRLEPHPRVLRFRDVTGVLPYHEWTVPVLISPDTSGRAVVWRSALDRLWRPGGWRDSDDLVPLLNPLLAIARGARLDARQDANNQLLVRLAIDILALSHHVDADLIDVAGWISMGLYAGVLRAAMDHNA